MGIGGDMFLLTISVEPLNLSICKNNSRRKEVTKCIEVGHLHIQPIPPPHKAFHRVLVITYISVQRNWQRTSPAYNRAEDEINDTVRNEKQRKPDSYVRGWLRSSSLARNYGYVRLRDQLFPSAKNSLFYHSSIHDARLATLPLDRQHKPISNDNKCFHPLNQCFPKPQDSARCHQGFREKQ